MPSSPFLVYSRTASESTGKAARHRPFDKDSDMTAERVLVIQHFAPEGPGLIGEILEDHGYELDIRRVDFSAPVPENADGFAAVVVMGGPMSAYDPPESFPSRDAEVALIREVLDAGTPFLGVCLGAQLLVAAAGARVYPGSAGKEVGWGEIELSPAASNDPVMAGAPQRFGVLHWHGDTFDAPPEAEVLATTDRYIQALRVGRRAWGLQPHIEADEVLVKGFVTAMPDEAEHAPGGAQAILAEASQEAERLRPVAEGLLRRFAEQCRNPGST